MRYFALGFSWAFRNFKGKVQSWIRKIKNLEAQKIGFLKTQKYQIGNGKYLGVFCSRSPLGSGALFYKILTFWQKNKIIFGVEKKMHFFELKSIKSSS